MNRTAPRILVIAYEPALCFTIEELLRAYGYNVIIAKSAAALHVDAEDRFATILLDSALLAKPTLEQSPPAQLKSHDERERWPILDLILI